MLWTPWISGKLFREESWKRWKVGHNRFHSWSKVSKVKETFVVQFRAFEVFKVSQGSEQHYFWHSDFACNYESADCRVHCRAPELTLAGAKSAPERQFRHSEDKLQVRIKQINSWGFVHTVDQPAYQTLCFCWATVKESFEINFVSFISLSSWVHRELKNEEKRSNWRTNRI